MVDDALEAIIRMFFFDLFGFCLKYCFIRNRIHQLQLLNTQQVFCKELDRVDNHLITASKGYLMFLCKSSEDGEDQM